MKTTAAIICIFLGSVVGYAQQSQLISKTPNDGIGSQTVSIHSHSGQADGASNLAFNLLYNVSEGVASTKRWYNNTNWYPWVIFELTDFYSLDKIVFRDVRTKETQYGNVPEYHVYVSSELPENCRWKRVYYQQGDGSTDVKEIIFNNVDSVRYIKFVCSPGLKTDNTYDDGVRIYGLDIYGTFTGASSHESLSVGKSILGFNGTANYYQRPLNLLDGNTSNMESLWYSPRPTISDSLLWVVIDLETTCNINGFRLHDAKTLEFNAPNIVGYNVYVSTESPDIEKIKLNKDENTNWMRVVDAYSLDRTEENIKSNIITPINARYVKLEIPRSRTTGYVRLFQFEVLGETIASSVYEIKKLQDFIISPSLLKRGDYFQVHTENEGMLKIFNIHGMVVAQYIMLRGKQSISTQQLSSGMYIVTLNNENQKLIVQ